MRLHRTPMICLTIALSTGWSLAACDRQAEVATGAGGASGGSPVAEGAPVAVGASGLITDTTFASATAPQVPPEQRLQEDPPAAGLPDDRESLALTPSAHLLREADRAFLAAASTSTAYELALARMAFNRAREPEVKLFAAALIDHHSRAARQLREIADARGLALATTPTEPQQQVIAELGTASGDEFDNRFLQLASGAHQLSDSVSLEQAAKTAADTALRDFARNSLPAVQEHRRRANELQAARTADDRAADVKP